MNHKNDGDITITTHLSETEAVALAQLAKRLMHDDIKSKAVDGSETELMISAIFRLQNGLEEAGFAPR